MANIKEWDQRYTRNSSVSVRLLSEERAVLYHPDSGKEKVLNSTGLFIWQRLDGSLDIRGLINDIAGNFAESLPEQVTLDVCNFLRGMEAECFVIPRPTKSSAELQREYPSYMDAPQSLDLSLTGRCNLRCAYCFYDNEMTARGDLELEAWLDFFGELGRLAVRDVNLSGGEVFLRTDLWEMIDSLIANRMRYSISTNGTLINEKTIQAFEQGLRRLRLSSIQVSIDGSCAEVHDKSRGKGTFDKAIRGLRLLKEADLPATVRVTINRHNVQDLDNIAKLLLDEIGIDFFGTNDAMPMGSGCANQPDISITPQQLIEAMHSLSALAAKYDGRVAATAGPLAKWRSYREMEHARKTGQKPTRWIMGYLTSCGCMFNKLSVHHDGIITPCNMLAKLEIGRINVDSLSEIWCNHKTLKELKDRRAIPMSQVQGCETCEWNAYCNGSCPGLAYEMTGNFNLANPHDCYRLFLKATGGYDFNKI